MLSSRGFVYLDGKSAAPSDRYHGDCDCQAVAEWEADQHYITGYDPDRMYDQYLEARAATDALGQPLNDRNIAVQMRTLFPDAFTDGHTH